MKDCPWGPSTSWGAVDSGSVTRPHLRSTIKRVVMAAKEQQPRGRDRWCLQDFATGVGSYCAPVMEQPEMPVQSMQLTVDFGGRPRDLDRGRIPLGKRSED